MNYMAMAHYVGLVLRLEALCMLPALCVSLYYAETAASLGFVLSMVIVAVIGVVIGSLPWKRDKKDFKSMEGFILGAVCWIIMAVLGALPYRFSGASTSFTDCLFESVSGFTTTAASIFTDVEILPKGILFWRGFSLWIGGAGVLVLLIATFSNANSQSARSIMQAELTGPDGISRIPRLRQWAKILYLIYIGLTIIEIAFLLIGGMPLFDSVLTAMATAGTGGFSVKNASIAAYNSVYIENVITIFMILCGANYTIHYFLIIRNFTGVWKDEEFKAYIGIMAVSGVLIAINLYGRFYSQISQAFRYAIFQTVSIMTTTGFLTADFEVWPEFSKLTLFFLMFIGACSGSSAGGLKVTRIVLLIKEVRRALERMVRPRAVRIIKMSGKRVEYTTAHSINTYFVMYIVLYVISFFLISLDNFNFKTSLAAVTACMNNIGAGFGIMSYSGSYSFFSPFAKFVLMIDMLIGRLEIFPILVLFSPRTWRKI